MRPVSSAVMLEWLRIEKRNNTVGGSFKVLNRSQTQRLNFIKLANLYKHQLYTCKSPVSKHIALSGGYYSII